MTALEPHRPAAPWLLAAPGAASAATMATALNRCPLGAPHPQTSSAQTAVWMVRADGRRQPLPVARWLDAPDRADRILLDACHGATVDVGCGPGRLTAALTARAIVALGVDTSETAVRLARSRGAAALRRSIFDPLPGESRWQHALLADGNIGIGGDPSALLRRLAALLARGGTVLVETDPPGTGIRQESVRLIRAGAPAGPAFCWAWVAADALGSLAGAAGLRPRWSRSYDSRWFAELERP